MTTITTPDLTTGNAAGTGIFDTLMRAVKAHLDEEFKRGAIKGPEYATVYLGSMNLAMQTGMSFLLQKQKTGLEVSLLEQQLLLAQTQVSKAAIELAILTASQAKIPAEIAQVEAQTALLVQQKLGLVAESLNIPKQGALLDAQLLATQKQVEIADAELDVKLQQVLVSQHEVSIAAAKLINIPKEGVVLDAQAGQITQQTTNLAAEKTLTDNKAAQTSQQTTNLVAEALNIPKQGVVLDAQALLVGQQKLNLVSENLGIVAKTALTTEQAESEALRNFVHPTDPTLSGAVEQERHVLIAQECKLKAEFDLTVSTTAKSAGEIALLAQKTATERAQILSTGVDADSVVGKQKALYGAQTSGFTRDAEQKAADLLIKTWSVRRSTNDLEEANAVNKLDNTFIGRAVEKLLTGVGA